MEAKGQHPRTVSGAVHFGGLWPGNQFRHHTVRRMFWQPSFAEEFHTFGVEWSEAGISWFIDGEVKREMAPSEWGADEGCAPFDKRFHLLLNLAVGGTYGGPPDAHTRFPAAMEIDWVRVWQ